jgi:hypothetical protein
LLCGNFPALSVNLLIFLAEQPAISFSIQSIPGGGAMPADQLRNRTVGCKMNDSEYEKLARVAEQDGQTLGEWCREVLLERAEGRKPTVIEEPCWPRRWRCARSC